MGPEGDNAAVIEAMSRERLEETEGRTQHPSPTAPDRHHRRPAPDGGAFDVETVGGTAWDELSGLEGFAGLFADGGLEVGRVREIVEAIRSRLQDEAFAGWRDLAEVLRAWPMHPGFS